MSVLRWRVRGPRVWTPGLCAVEDVSAGRVSRWLAFGTFVLVCSSSVLVAAKPPVLAARSAEDEPPPRPSSEGVQEPARLLFRAIVEDQPALADAFFFPRDAFVLVKAMARPERYWERLHARFVADIHALHQRTPDLARASFVRLELTARGGYVRPFEEGNKLSYWAARHAWLHYRVGDQPRKLEVRVLITWRDTWYVIHLDEFH